LIEDDAELLAMLCQAFLTAGYNVRTAVNGEAGLAAFRAAPADLVVTDMFMPERDGVETILGLRLLDPLVKIIAIGGSQGVHSNPCLEVAWHIGANETLAKPFQAEAILELAAKVLVTMGTRL
jgi:DNA-binding NtrC family response regulator